MTTYSTINRNTTTYSAAAVSFDEDFLLMETSDFLLQENGDQIILEQSVQSETPYSTVSKNTTTYSSINQN